VIDVKVGIPREVKNNEFRVAITPAGVHELVRHGHQVLIEQNAGLVDPGRGVRRRGRADPGHGR
jgi:alanine dehydrogenase